MRLVCFGLTIVVSAFLCLDAKFSLTVVPIVLAPTGQFVCLGSFISTDLLITSIDCVHHTHRSALYALIAARFNVTHLQQLSETVRDRGWTWLESQSQTTTSADLLHRNDSLPVVLRVRSLSANSTSPSAPSFVHALSPELAVFRVHPPPGLIRHIRPACLHSLSIKPSRPTLLYWDSDRTWFDQPLMRTQHVRLVSTVRCSSHFPMLNMTFTLSPLLQALRCVVPRLPDVICMSQPGSPLMADPPTSPPWIKGRPASRAPRLLGLSLFAGTCNAQSPLLLSTITRRLHSSALSRYFC